MKKGTQEISMFKNEDALLGYVWTKFVERGTLVVLSLSKLDPNAFDIQDTNKYESKLHQKIWNQLLKVQTACSIGSGPGCDAAGLISFLRSHKQKYDQQLPSLASSSYLLESFLFLDWAVEEWKFVTTPLESILVPQQIRRIDSEFCDVTVSLHAASNHKVLQKLLRKNSDNHNEISNADTVSTTFKELGCDSSNTINIKSSCDIFLISYLLTETHNKWDAFLIELVELSNPGTLFYFAEPNPWQLHRVVNLFQDRQQQARSLLDFVWLDSSFNNPCLQALGSRSAFRGSTGAGVLMAIKKQ